MIENRLRIEEGDELSAAQDKLVDRILRRIGDALRMDDDEHLHVVGNLVRVHLHRLHFEILLEFAVEHPGRLAALAHLHHHGIHLAARHGERAHDADHWFLRGHDPRDGAGDFVFEQAFALRELLGIINEQLNRLLAVEHAHAQAEIDRVAFGPRLLAVDVVELGRILGVRIRHRVELLDFDQPVRGLLVFAEEILHVLRIGFQHDGHPIVVARPVKADLHRRIELGQNRAGARRERVGALFREIDARLGAIGEGIDGDDDDKQRHYAKGRKEPGIETFLLHDNREKEVADQPARCARMMTLVVKREKTITERKKRMSRESSTPF